MARDMIRDLIQKIKSEKGLEYSNNRGNILWGVKDGKIHCYILGNNGEEWTVLKHLTEEDFEALSCPIIYLDKTPPVNVEWRQKVGEYKKKKDHWKTAIEDLYKEKGTVTVKLKGREGYSLNVDTLIIERIKPSILGRSPVNHKLYKVPLYLVHEIQ